MKNKLDWFTLPVGTYQCNCTVIWNQDSMEAVIIDPGNDPLTLKNLVQNRGFKVKALYHTHAHFDHIGASGDLAETWGVPLGLHPADKELYQMLPLQSSFFGVDTGKIGDITLAFKDEQSLTYVDTFHTPGHTQGSVCFYTELLTSPLLMSGDTLFKNSVGRTDLPGGDFDTLKWSIKNKIYSLRDEVLVVPGHGPTTTIGEEKRKNPFVRA